MAWLGEELPETEQDARVPLRADLGGRPWEPGTAFAPRCTKDLIEERLFAQRRDLFSRLDLVFMDTTSLYFEGAGSQTLGRHGHSKDHRPDLCQMILAVLVDGDGRPVCSEIWPGNAADIAGLIPVIDRLRRRFAIGRICVVADRGMISAETVAELEARKLLSLLGGSSGSGFRQRDYERKKRARQRAKRAPDGLPRCAECGELLPDGIGPATRFCSKDCRRASTDRKMQRKLLALEARRRPSPADQAELWHVIPRHLTFEEIVVGQQAPEACAGDPLAAVQAGDPVMVALVAIARARRAGVPMPPYDGV